MAEAIVAAALAASAKFLIEHVAPAAITYCGREVSLATQVHDKVRGINEDLGRIRSILSYADRVAAQKVNIEDLGQKEIIQNWVKNVRIVSFRVMKILDNHMYNLLHHSERGGRVSRVVNLSKCKGCMNKICLLSLFGRTSKEVDGILPSVRSIMNIYNDTVQAALSPMLPRDPGSWTTGEPSSSGYRGEDNFSGCKDEDVFFSSYDDGRTKKELVETWIKMGMTESELVDWRWRVIAVWGMAGVGKTTLMRNVFHNIKHLFQVFVEVKVSRTYEIDKLLRKMLKGMEQNVDGTIIEVGNEERNASLKGKQLCARVRDELDKNSYLIFFDDIWDVQFCSVIQSLFGSDDNRRSRILVTTRNWEVAVSLARDEERVINLPRLEENEAWSLFCKKAFWQFPQNMCPEHLEDLAKTIVEKCYGLPLAIVAAGCFMSRKRRDARVWETFTRTPMNDQGNDLLEDICYDLEPHLKSCFLYCGTFPENYAFAKEDVIRLWIAEGFIEYANTQTTLEEQAVKYLEELIDRSLFEVAERADSGEIRSCRIHDVIRRIAKNSCSEQLFSVVLDGNVGDKNVNDAYRLSILPTVGVFPSRADLASLRSFLMFSRDDLTTIFSSLNFKLLKVLNLRDSTICCFPDEIFSLYLLRYLNLSNTRIKVDEIPEKIKRLQHLQTFELLNTEVKRLPRGIAKLSQLRHLLFDGPNPKSGGLEAPAGICNLNNLQTLKHVKASTDFVTHIGTLTQLRALWISAVQQTHEAALLNSLRSTSDLRELTIRMVAGCSIDLSSLLHGPLHLQSLSVNGGLPTFPTWFGELRELKQLELTSSILQEDPCGILGSLPSLRVLFMENAYEGSTLTFSSSSFSHLEVLKISDLLALTSINIDNALPKLRKLQISRCGKLGRPVFLAEKLQRLKEFKLEGFDLEVANDFEKLQGYNSNLTLIVMKDKDVTTRHRGVPSASNH